MLKTMRLYSNSKSLSTTTDSLQLDNFMINLVNTGVAGPSGFVTVHFPTGFETGEMVYIANVATVGTGGAIHVATSANSGIVFRGDPVIPAAQGAIFLL